MKIIYIIRHPQTEHNFLDAYQGLADSPITDLGKDQIKEQLHYFETRQIDLVYTSPLERCIYLAEEFKKTFKLQYARDERLKEVCYGRWDGKLKKDLGDDPAINEKAKNRFRFKHPGQFEGHEGESYLDLYNRLISFWDEVCHSEVKPKNLAKRSTRSLNEFGMTSGNILVIGHTGVMMAAKKYFEKVSDEEISMYRPSNDEVLTYETI